MSKPTLTDALNYLKEVRETLQDGEKYDMFLDVMKAFKARRIGTDDALEYVNELFRGHNNLIIGFKTFLPKAYEITHSDEPRPRSTVYIDVANRFLRKIKERFQDDVHVYKSFLDCLSMYRDGHRNIHEVCGQVSVLFGDHKDLLEEFVSFLPVYSAEDFDQMIEELHLYELSSGATSHESSSDGSAFNESSSDGVASHESSSDGVASHESPSD